MTQGYDQTGNKNCEKTEQNIRKNNQKKDAAQ